MKKNIFITFSLLMISVLLGVFLYSRYLNPTFQSFQNNILDQISNMGNQSNTPQEVLNKNCTFDLATQTDDFLKTKPEFSEYYWDDEQKIATIILNNQETLLIHRGGCAYFNFYGTLVIAKSDIKVTNKNEIIEKALWIAAHSFEIQDYNFFKYSIETGDYDMEMYTNEFKISFHHPDYCTSELYFSRDQEKHEIMIKIGFQICP